MPRRQVPPAVPPSQPPQPSQPPPTVRPADGAAVPRGHPLSQALRDLVLAGDEVDLSLARRLHLNPTDYAAMNHLMTGSSSAGDSSGTAGPHSRPNQYGRIGPVELGARLGITSGSATGLADRLEAAGHVERRPHPSDRRRLVLVPTASTIRTIVDVLRPMTEDLDALGAEFTEEEQAAVHRYLSEAARRLRAYAHSLQTPPSG